MGRQRAEEDLRATTTILKPAYEPSLFFPFAAPPVHGTLADSGELFESQARLMLWGVERAITGFAKIGADTDVQHKLHVILPGSPNRGVFGGDGAYGEVKSAFDAIVNRARAEKVWSSRVTFAHPKIGWVRAPADGRQRSAGRSRGTSRPEDLLHRRNRGQAARAVHQGIPRAGRQGPARRGPDRRPRQRADQHQGTARRSHGGRGQGRCRRSRR